ncbi:OLC1v1031177C1 [Oldenlandia corymbosa var. corymbosa]|uniref:OLC1v1031177C1 n=1 Tax=Oldenlandia corymbosa var. corymbosa TaxID=529605 RepID=A0AAV1CHY1_OLDCO|nr:OLC1v1031177C1 [Oldenlandia corymbosa var. corymbosa]
MLKSSGEVAARGTCRNLSRGLRKQKPSLRDLQSWFGDCSATIPELQEQGTINEGDCEGQEEDDDALIEDVYFEQVSADDGFVGISSDVLDSDSGVHGCWSKGEKDNALVHDSDKGLFHEEVTISHKRGPKSKAEKAELLKGVILRRSPGLHRHGFILNLLEDLEQVLHFKVTNALVSEIFYFSAVYAKSAKVERRTLWRHMATFRQLHPSAPWLIGDDFNVIRTLEEYSGTLVQDLVAILEFNECLQECDLDDIQAIGKEFTWGGTQQTGWVCKKLNRVLITPEWQALFLVSSLENLNRTTSDHCPMLQFDVQASSKPKERRLRQGIFKIQSQNGETLTNPVDIEQEAVASFKSLLNDNDIDALCEAMTRRLKDLVAYGTPVGSLLVSHLAFTDDVIIFSRGLQTSLRELNVFLSDYEIALGQKKGSFPFTYLGCKLYLGRRKAATYQLLLDTIDRRLLGWKNKLLSQGGCLVLIKHVLSTIPVHVFSALPPPKSILQEIEKRCQKFLWSAMGEEPRHHWRSWEGITYPTSEKWFGNTEFQ